jgi:hypothetical protein
MSLLKVTISKGLVNRSSNGKNSMPMCVCVCVCVCMTHILVRMTYQILQSLLLLFDHNVIHCDLKPEVTI